MKKLLALLLVLVLSISVFAACGKKDTDTGTDTAEGSTVVKIVIKDVLPEEEGTIMLEKAIEEKMAEQGQVIDIQFIEPPAGSYGTALPLGVRSGEIDADIIYFQGGDQPISESGEILDLTDYVAGSTHIKAAMEPAGVKRTENYPYLLWLAPARVPVPTIRGDWAAQLDSYEALIADPTVDNYYNLFKELKDKGMVEYAITGDGSLVRWDSVFNQAFGVTSTLIEQDGRTVYAKATDVEKAKLEFYAKLYAEGLIDPEYLTNSWDVAEQKFYEGKVGLYATNAGATVKIINEKMVSTNRAEAELVILPPAKGVGSNYSSIDVTKEPRGFAINAESKNPDAAFAILEFLASPEGRNIELLGIEGVHYNVEGDQVVFTEQRHGWWTRFWETLNNFEPPHPLAEPLYSSAPASSLEMAAKYYQEDVNQLIPEDLTPLWDGMNGAYQEFSTDIIRGEKDSSEFSKFVETWNAAGGDRFAEYFAENK